jgi:hypothetical protein
VDFHAGALILGKSKTDEGTGRIIPLYCNAVDDPRRTGFYPGVTRNSAQDFVSQKLEEANLLKNFGEPGRTRTYNPLIKSQLLYH